MNNVMAPEAADWIGRSITYPAYPVTAIDIAKFAYAVGISNPIHLDHDAAVAAGHPGVVAPLGFHLVIRHAVPNLTPLSELAADGGGDDLTPPSAARRRMAGESTTEFLAPIHAGDVITLTKRVADIEEKAGRSGPLAFVGYALQFRNQDDLTVVNERYVRILR